MPDTTPDLDLDREALIMREAKARADDEARLFGLTDSGYADAYSRHADDVRRELDRG